MENPDLVLQETGSRPTYSRLNYVPSGDTLRRDAISSFSFVNFAEMYVIFRLSRIFLKIFAAVFMLIFLLGETSAFFRLS